MFAQPNLVGILCLIARFLAGNYYKLALIDSLKYSSEVYRSIDTEFSSVEWKFILGFLVVVATIIGFVILGDYYNWVVSI
jgi:hypothetical protein